MSLQPYKRTIALEKLKNYIEKEFLDIKDALIISGLDERHHEEARTLEVIKIAVAHRKLNLIKKSLGGNKAAENLLQSYHPQYRKISVNEIPEEEEKEEPVVVQDEYPEYYDGEEYEEHGKMDIIEWND